MIRALLIAFLTLTAAPAPQTTTPPPAPPFEEALAAKLPVVWRQPVAAWLTIPEAQHARLLAMNEESLRQNLARQLVRVPAADAFIKGQLRDDPSSRVRTAIVQAIAGDARWMAQPETSASIECVVSSDPDVAVSLSALEALRRLRLRGLPALLAERLAAARKSGDAAAAARLAQEHERWINLERGSMLPAFLRDAPPAFAVLPSGRAVRVLAFGDYGTGTAPQKETAKVIAAYDRARPFDLAITMGDNFYTAGMESPSDPRWQTWFEDLYAPLGITFYPSLGNHDWGLPDSPAAEILYRSKSNSWRMPASYYTFTAGSVQFFALDTQTVALSERQSAWLDEELSRSTATWKIVYGHHPIYTAGNYQDRPDLIAKLMPVMRNRVDMYLAGHDHNFQALRADVGVHFYVAGGGGAGLYPIREHERLLFASSAHGFAVIEADASHLAISFVDATGKTIYVDTLRKPTATAER